MPINQTQLLAALADPTIAAMTDADAATALSAPILTPRPTPITLKSLTAADCWGFSKTSAFQAALNAVVASGGANGASATTFLDLLKGTGFDATDPQVQALIPAFVAMGGGTITTDDATTALNTTTYRCGSPVIASDVTAARAAITRQTAIDATRQAVTAAYAGWVNEVLNVAASDPTKTIPTFADFKAAIAAS